MDAPERKPPLRRIGTAILEGLKGAAKTIWFLVKIVVPVTFAVAFLGWCGALALIAKVCSPVMGLLGLPGDAALVFISSIFLNIYSAIAVAGSIALNMRELSILAVMCLIAHNMIVETAVMKKTGSSATKMVILRVGMALVAALLFNLLLPSGLSERIFSSGGAVERTGFLAMAQAWALSTAKLVIKITLIVSLVMIVQRLLEEFKIMVFLSKILTPVVRFLGLPPSTSFLLIVINIVGYAYGAGIVTAEISSGKMKPQEGDLFNHHAGICHSLLEDTTLFAVLGVSVFWLIIPRLALAILVVWIERIRRHYVRRSFRAAIG